MSKQRILPLMMYDLTRTHGFGEVDFITCTDKDNGFIAKVRFINTPQDVDHISTTQRECNGITALFSIVRLTGANPKDSLLRTLLRAAADGYVERTAKQINCESPTVADYISFLEQLATIGRQSLKTIGSNFKERSITQTSIGMIESIIKHLKSDA